MSKKIRLDIGGPKGNAFYILGLVKGLTGGDKELTESITNEMKSSNYDNLLRTFKKHFPMVEFYSTIEIPTIDSELYVVDDENIEL